MERIRLELGAVGAVVALGTSSIAAPMLLALEGAPPGDTLVWLGWVGIACAVANAALALALPAPALAALGAASAPSLVARESARLFPVRFAVACSAVWLAVAGLLGHLAAEAPDPVARLWVLAGLGVLCGAASALLSARAAAPLCRALCEREPGLVLVPAPSLAWTVRLLATSLVLGPALLHTQLEAARAGAPAGLPLSPESVALLVLALGLGELVVRSLGERTRALRAATASVIGVEARANEASLEEVSAAVLRLGRAVAEVVESFDAAAVDLDGGLTELDSARGQICSLTDAQVAGVQRLTQSMSSVYAHSEKIGESIQDLRGAVDESSSAVTQLGAAGEQLAGTAADLLVRADTVSHSIQTALESVGEVAGSTDVLAGVAAESSSAMEEIAASMRDVNENAEHCAELSDRVVGVADQGSQVVQRTIDGMQAIREATATAERVIRGLGERAGEIGAIVDVIDGVANETSLLALNAAIIAAQAGEHGRGFSVVAGEIRELATRVTSSTSEITDLIRSVQEESSNAIRAIEGGTESVATGVGLSEQAGQSLVEITLVARDNKKRVQGIVASVREQTKASGHVVGMIEEVRSQAERIRNAARDQERGNDLVMEQARALRDIAGQVHHTTDEHSRGTQMIVSAVESIRTGLDTIGTSVQEQTEGCSNVVASTGEAYTRAKETHQAAGSLTGVAERLASSKQALRRLIEKLRG